MYVAGDERRTVTDYNWRIEKRNLGDGSLVSGFGVSGVATSTGPSAFADVANSISIDASAGYMYVAGYEGQSGSDYNWRIEKRNLGDGSLVSAFGVSGVATSTGPGERNDQANSISIDASAGFMYVAGYETDSAGGTNWRIEKRNLGDGSLVSGFGVSGVATSSSPGTDDDQANSIAIDASAGFMYVAGYEVQSGSDYNWRVEKRNLGEGS